MQQAFYGWVIVAAVHILLAVIFGSVYSFGIFFNHIRESYAVSHGAVATIFSITAFLYYGIGLFSGYLSDRFSPRIIIGIGISFLSVGLALTGFSSTFTDVVVIFCLFVGIGVGFVYIPAISIIPRWFVKNRSKATSIAITGTGVGTIFIPLLVSILLQYVSWSYAMISLAVGAFSIGLIATSFIERDPKCRGLMPMSETYSETILQSETVSKLDLPLSLAIKTKVFWNLFSVILLASISLFVTIVHIVPYAIALNIPQSKASFIISAIGVGNILGRFGVAGFGDTYAPSRLLMWVTLCLAALSLIWLAAETYWLLLVFAILFGAANGGSIALYPVVTAAHFGTRYIGAILGALFVSVGIAALAGPSLAGFIFDSTKNYSAVIIITALCCALSALLLFFVRKKFSV